MNDDTPTPKPDGGPMFPNPAIGWGGMTLRDWFAGQALAGILAAPDMQKGRVIAATRAYEHADAMIALRNTTREG